MQTNKIEIYVQTLDLRIGVRIPACQPHSFVYSTGRDFLWRGPQGAPVGARQGVKLTHSQRTEFVARRGGLRLFLLAALIPKCRRK
jgi:hypothetical protein